MGVCFLVAEYEGDVIADYAAGDAASLTAPGTGEGPVQVPV